MPLNSRTLGAFFAILIPWLNPFTFGPTPAVLPWLTSAACTTVLLFLVQRHGLEQLSAAAWVVAAVLSALIGLLQYFGASGPLGSWVNHAAVGEAFGNLRQRNQFATLTSIGLLALLYGVIINQHAPLFAIKVKAPYAQLVRAGVGFCIILLALGNAVSGSRTGFVQWVLILVLAAIWHGRSRHLLLGATCFALLVYWAGILLLPIVLEQSMGVPSGGVLKRFQDSAGCSSRWVLWSNVLQLITIKPWTGWGWGELDYAHFITLYPGERFCEILDNAHNLPLHLAVELGVPVALLVSGGLLWLTLRAKPWRERNAMRQLAWGVLAVIGLHSLLEYPLWYGPFQMATGLSVLILWPVVRARTALVAAVSIAIMAMVILAAWDYWRISQLYMAVPERSSRYQHGTLDKVRNTWFFGSQVAFAELTTTPLTPENASTLHAMAVDLLHFSPEPSVAQIAVDSATLLGWDDTAHYYAQRYQAAFGRDPLAGNKAP